MELGRRRGIEEQITPKLERTQDDLVAVSCDAEGTSQRLDGEIYQYRFQKFRLYDKSAKSSCTNRCIIKTHRVEHSAGSVRIWSQSRAISRFWPYIVIGGGVVVFCGVVILAPWVLALAMISLFVLHAVLSVGEIVLMNLKLLGKTVPRDDSTVMCRRWLQLAQKWLWLFYLYKEKTPPQSIERKVWNLHSTVIHDSHPRENKMKRGRRLCD